MLANQLKSAAVADLLHVRKAQQKERAHRLLASGFLYIYIYIYICTYLYVYVYI